jgi:hypothetical protein
MVYIGFIVPRLLAQKLSILWESKASNPQELGHVIYGGDTLQHRTQGVVTGWKCMPVWSELSCTN